MKSVGIENDPFFKVRVVDFPFSLKEIFGAPWLGKIVLRVLGRSYMYGIPLIVPAPIIGAS